MSSFYRAFTITLSHAHWTFKLTNFILKVVFSYKSVLGDQAFKINITHKFPIFEKISPVKNYPKVCLFSLWRKRISQKLCTTSPPLPNIIYGVYNVHVWPWYLPCMNLTIATGWNLKIKYWSMLPIKLLML